MAQPQPAQRDDVLNDFEDWAGDFARKADAAGRQFWNGAARTGQGILDRTQRGLSRVGAAQLNNAASSRAASPTAGATAGNSWLDRSEAAKFLGGQVAEGVGRAAGVGRGAWHSAVGAAQGADFLNRLLNPSDVIFNGPDSAWGHVLSSGEAAADYVRKGFANPAGLRQDILNAGHRFRVGIDPTATPVAPTFTGEMARRFGTGLNQGELGWDVASLVAGTPALKAVEGLGAIGDATSAAKFAEMGFTDAQAARLAEPYTGVGHHSPVSQSLAKTLRLPDWLRDSSFNVVKPDGMNQGDFYKFHFQTDPQYYGSGFSPKIGGPGWSGKKLGFQKYGLLNRFWYGTPTPLAGLSATAGVAGLSDYHPAEDPAQ